MGLYAQQARWIGEHRSRVGLGEALTPQQVEEDLRVPPAHVSVTLALDRAIAEMPPSVDHLLGRAPADSKLQTSASDEVCGSRVLDHVERVLIAHVDDRRADLDTAGLGAYGCQQRQRRSELAGEVVNTEIESDRAQRLGGDAEIDGLQDRIGCRARLRL